MTTLIPKFDFKNGGSTPTGAVNRPINEKLSEIISVKDFGAIGDGTTDDTVAIQAAITYAATITTFTQKAAVYIPEGKYLFSSTLNITCSVFGGVGELIFSGTGIAITLTGHNYLHDFTLVASTSNATVGIYAINTASLRFDNISIYGSDGGYPKRWTTAAMQFDTTAPSNIFGVYINGLEAHQILGDVILFSGSGGSEIVHITNSSLQDCDAYGVRATASHACGSWNISSNEIEGFGNAVSSGMVKLGFVLSAVIQANHFEHSATAVAPILTLGKDVYCANLSLKNNNIAGAGTAYTTYLIDLGNTQNTEISENYTSGATYVINNPIGIASSVIQNNSVALPMVLFNGTTNINTTTISDNTQTYWASDDQKIGITQKLNAAARGFITAKPGTDGLVFYKNRVLLTYAIGDFLFNAAPASAGYIGWVCTYGGIAHGVTNGTLTSGSNVITSVTGSIFDWAIGDLICTNTDALGIPAGTTVTNVGSTTITISTTATASGSVALFGARFAEFGLIV